MIELKNIGVLRNDWVLRNINLEIEQGALIGIIGESGAGKTTLLKAISGLLDVAEGKVLFDGKKLHGPTEKLIAGYEEIQLVNQDFALETFHTVSENIKEKILHLPLIDQESLVKEFMELLELDHLADRQARSLSGGEQQRLSIARALASEPRYLLLDEPFAHLDQALRMKVMNYLSALNRIRKTTIVLVSHDGSELMGLAKELIHLADGGIERRCSTAEMYFLPESFEQAELLGVVNAIEFKGKRILFRPTEYDPTGDDLKIEFQHSLNTGMLVFNYYKTTNGEEVILAALDELADLTSVGISKKL